jgi:hypothetical protein
MRSNLLDLTCDLAAAIRVVEPNGGSLAHMLVRLVGKQPALYPLDSLRPLLICCAATGYTHKLQENVISALRKMLSVPVRDPDDYTTHDIAWQCHCQDCTQVINWAQSRTNSRLHLTMAAQQLKHVESNLNAAHAPFNIETVNSLVLSKPTNLHEADSAIRERIQRDLDLLTTSKS